MKQIIFNEWKMLQRTRVLLYLTLFFFLILVIVSWLGIVQNNNQLEHQKAAKAHIEAQWNSLDNMNPHSAAHYGSYAFKPRTPLNSIDDGINTITGNVIRLEGHAQNEMVYSEASQSLAISKFGKLKPALLLQYVIPLLLIFLGFATISNEKETGRLKLLLFQGALLPQIVFGKAFCVWLYGAILLIVTLSVQLILNNQGISSELLLRLGLLAFSYAAYYYIVSLLSTWFSAKLKTNAGSLASMLSVWVLWTIFFPKIWGNASEKLYPLPSRQEFRAAMQEDRSQGLDGHNPSDKRAELLKSETLTKYQVDSVSQLPINFDGLRMQADEDYGNIVWDKHFGENEDILKKQKRLYQWSGIINPFASLQSAGMGFSGSDMYHHLDFLHQAESYRRVLIKTLNEKQVYGGSKTGDWSWTENNEFYKSVKVFEYHIPKTAKIIPHYLIDLLCLFLWVLAVTSMVLFTVINKLK